MNGLIEFVNNYGLAAMVIVIMLEYACFPVSSEIVLPLSGALASLNAIPYLLLVALSVVAGLAGTCICYCIGRFGGDRIISGITTRFPRTKKGFDASVRKFDRFGKYAVCIGRLIPICRTYIAFIAGAAAQPFSEFVFSSMLGITLWNTLLIGAGYFLRESWETVGMYYDKYKMLLIPVLLLFILFFFYIRSVKKSRNQ